MRYQSIAVAMVGFALLATRIDAHDGDQVFETFDTHPTGTTNVIASGPYFSTTISGGTIEMASLANPAHSGNQVYGGTSITVVTSDQDMFSWPGVGAWVTGGATVWMRAYEYDEGTGTDHLLTEVSLSATDTNTYLSIGTLDDPKYISRVTFSSDVDFAIDDLTLGIDGIGPGIPEPASWAMMLGGFGLVGGAMRRRRTAGQVFCPQETAHIRI
ncbi:MAG TPA: PEPxxWA-CTERM sorting domain-containing protein [Sphingomonas sp.]|uniref:PEPxxWA-CTERM sorting domain-containing protein n=1 Tax=Sphingomonas sp. TaxID=28214 RepID=UPI002BB08C6D|nr:PEPxxWA-CTERM sorting domain-containing protein [Sphingomonas sp.]HMI18446.1 PEPxxWA-CTERM sorting domain-containing protein [Sphingomonas sp.]